MYEFALAELGARSARCRQLAVLIQTLEQNQSGEVQTLKGLSFVEMYGSYEYAVRATVQCAIESIRVEGAPASDLRQEILSLLFDSRFAGCAAGPKHRWKNRIELFEKLEWDGPVEIHDDVFPLDGSHFRSPQLHTIWRIFGISAPIVPDRRLLGRIDEIVENRNAIAHGRRTADEVGRRYSVLDISGRVSDTHHVTTYIVETMRNHHSTGGFRRPGNH